MTTTVRAVSEISVPVASRTNGYADRGIQNNAPGSRMTYSRLIGALFLVGFLFYGVGAALVTSVTGAPDFLATISAHQTTLVIGAFLMLLNTVVDVGKGVLFSDGRRGIRRSRSGTGASSKGPTDRMVGALADAGSAGTGSLL